MEACALHSRDLNAVLINACPALDGADWLGEEVAFAVGTSRELDAGAFGTSTGVATGASAVGATPAVASASAAALFRRRWPLDGFDDRASFEGAFRAVSVWHGERQARSTKDSRSGLT